VELCNDAPTLTREDYQETKSWRRCAVKMYIEDVEHEIIEYVPSETHSSSSLHVEPTEFEWEWVRGFHA